MSRLAIPQVRTRGDVGWMAVNRFHGTDDPNVLMDCPGCRQPIALHHAIDAEGVVAPSVVCPWPGCSFHTFVRLAGWDGGAVPRR